MWCIGIKLLMHHILYVFYNQNIGKYSIETLEIIIKVPRHIDQLQLHLKQ